MAKAFTDKLIIEILDGKWGSGETRKKKLTDAGYDYDAVQKRVNVVVAKMNTRKEAMKPWYDACKIQYEWSYDARYDWGKWNPRSIAKSKEYGTCITFPNTVAMRCGLIKEPARDYITSTGTNDDDVKTQESFWKNSVDAMNSINSKYWSSVKFPNQTVGALVKEGKIKEGDIVGLMGHTTMYAGKSSDGTLLFNNSGHAAGISGSKPGSNRAVLNQKANYKNRLVYGVFSVNTFIVITNCTGGTITASNRYMAGQQVVISIKPNAGMSVKSIKVDGKAVKASNTVTFSKIDAHHIIDVVCEKGTAKKGYTGTFPSYRLKKTNAQVIADTIKWAKWIASNNNFHYGYGTHAHHNGCFFCGTQKMKMNCGIKMPEYTYCCNPFVGAAWAHGGGDATAYKKCHNGSSWDFGTGSGSYHTSTLFTNLGKPAYSELKAGDVLCGDPHVALYIGDGKVVQASGGDDNVIYSARWNKSIAVGTWNGWSRAYRYKGSVDADRPLYYGEVSDRVADLQRFLDWYTDGKFFKECGGADGIYGDNTLKYVKDFQEKEIGKGQGDGWVGPKTIEAMKKVTK